MNSETLVTLLLTLLAIIFGIINARQKKRHTTAIPPVRRDPNFPHESEMQREYSFQASKPTINGNQLPEEAPPATLQQPITDPHIEKKPATNQKKYGFNAKDAVLYSEILKPKYDEFG
ncbi:MAG TPA: hypothetical protein P5167_03315 [Bacteroidales bacterium]|nr:hypothetical protein [Bacteroidales bacterium]HRW94857.1 hypothetical protein [Bacteroidales bacterium]